LLGDDHRRAEAERRRAEDLDVGHHVVAPVGVHRVEQALLHVDHDQRGMSHELSCGGE
jgi:hypothetical protein